jgi:hypothetical protein
MLKVGDLVRINDKPIYLNGKIGLKETNGGSPVRVVGPMEQDGCYPLSPYIEDDEAYFYFTEEHLDKVEP